MNVGDRFGRRVVLEVMPGGGRDYGLARVRCDCGREDVVGRPSLRTSTQCRDCSQKALTVHLKPDVTEMRAGDRFGEWTVIDPAVSAGKARARCSCGNEKVMRRGSVRNSLRCTDCWARLAGREVIHGHSLRGRTTREYQAWAGAKKRTTNPNTSNYDSYGGRGIRMAEEWLNDFPAFLAYIGPHPGKGYSLDRIDNDGNYEPGNVRWATARDQARNRRPARWQAA